MLEELKGLGFEWVELSHGIRLSLIPGILQGVDEGLIKVSSVHNFCPLPPGVMGAAPNLYEPTARTQRERMLWRNHTLKTIDFAHRVGAELVVVHCGSVRPFFYNPEKRWDQKLEKMEARSPEQLAFVEKIRNWMNKKKGVWMERLVTSLGEVIPRARERGIRLGLENREGLLELPVDADFATLFDSLNAEDVVGYWHDSGHAEIKSRYGFIRHSDLLEGQRSRQRGFHLHDVSEEGRDHQVPGSGVIDWDLIARQIRETDLLVLEMSPRLRSESVKEGRRFVEERLVNLGNG